MNHGAFFSSIILLSLIPLFFAVQDLHNSSSLAIAEGFGMAESVESVSLERFAIETAFDGIISDSLESSDGSSEASQKIVSLAMVFAEKENARESKTIVFFASRAAGKKENFNENVFRESFVVSELPAGEARLLSFYSSGGVLKNVSIKAEIHGKKASDVFILPTEYSSEVIK